MTALRRGQEITKTLTKHVVWVKIFVQEMILKNVVPKNQVLNYKNKWP